MAIDISPEAIEVAQKNAALHDVESRIDFVISDLFDAVDPNTKFDLIVSHPPYIGLGEKDEMESTVKDYEPHIALFGGEVGTEIIAKLLDQSADRLNPRGILMFETSPIVIDQCVELINSRDAFFDTKVHQDLSNQPRIVETSLR